MGVERVAVLSDPRVGLATAPKPWEYPAQRPFPPEEEYPELAGRVRPGAERNIVYPLFRQLARSLGLDAARYGTPEWNPLGGLVEPGQKVLLKPNLVRDEHTRGGDYQAVVTHASVVRCVLDYVALAMKGQGVITVGDAPVQNTDFARLLERTALAEVCDDVSRTWQIPVRLVDFRVCFARFDADHRMVDRGKLEGSPEGSRLIDLGSSSLLAPLSGDCAKFRVTNYDPQAMKRHHDQRTHQYVIAQTVLDADVVINLPKLKTHRKVALTAALKNLVGINAHKDCLPHHRCGSVVEGGDEYRGRSLLKRMIARCEDAINRAPFARSNGLRGLAIRMARRLGRYLWAEPYQEGSWYGNDTLWRTVLDLNRILFYANRQGIMTDEIQRHCFTVVDGVIGGEGEGPMEPDARPCGLLAGGANPAAIDAVLATLIGFDYVRIPLIAKAFRLDPRPLVCFSPEDVRVCCEDPRLAGLRVGKPRAAFRFKPPSGWVGHVECSPPEVQSVPFPCNNS